MTEQPDYLNNPLHGLKLEALLEQLINQYGWEILAEYTRINCFKNNPSMESSIKFFKKTEWAREKIERFYLYEYKNLPKAPEDQFEIPPRDRIIPSHHKPKEPKILKPGQAPIPKDRAGDKNKPKSFGNYRNQSSGGEKRHNDRPSVSSGPVDPYAKSPK
ncbi:DUF2132 domain-containing protein [Thalassotalea sp. M1531]|uniref:DUF2132 domain-containing protein n=1 Tax=Thalassotalea algicola TaxID=2716224 RepID=A0A7Y0Q763_9GAMM|nr:VF530 family protein [Thalassotalea algicola]NMP32704.1 DUF2132 domain-containing protein [Thalassotalea algicola]